MEQNPLKQNKRKMLPSYVLQKTSLSADAHRNPCQCKAVFSSPSVKKESVEGDEPMGWSSSSEWDLLLQALPSFSESKDAPGLLKLEGQGGESAGAATLGQQGATSQRALPLHGGARDASGQGVHLPGHFLPPRWQADRHGGGRVQGEPGRWDVSKRRIWKSERTLHDVSKAGNE